jgi:hypothetical protein
MWPPRRSEKAPPISDFATAALRERKKGAGLRVLEPEFCTSTDTGRILMTVLGMVAEAERRFIVERQRAGIEAAKKKGVYKGRKASDLECIVICPPLPHVRHGRRCSLHLFPVHI